MEQSVEFNSFEKFNVKRWHHCPYFTHVSDIFKEKKDFSKNPVNLDMGI